MINKSGVKPQEIVHLDDDDEHFSVVKGNKMDLKKVAEALADRPGGAITKISKDAYFYDHNPVAFYIE